MKKRILKILSLFLIFFIVSLTVSQERKKVTCNAEVITLTAGTVYTVSQILIAVGVITSESACSMALVKAFLTPQYVSTEQDMRIRAMTPTSCDTPGCIHEEDLKSAYKFKQDIKNGTVVLPKISALQTFNAVGDFSIVNSTDNISNFYNYTETERVKMCGLIRLQKVGRYKLTASLKNGQNYGNNGFSAVTYYDCTEINSCIVFMSILGYHSYDLRLNFLDSKNNTIPFRYSDVYHDYENSTIFKSDSISKESDNLYFANSFIQNSTYDFSLEFLDSGVGVATGETTVELSPDLTQVNTTENCIPDSQAQSICVRVPGDIANGWDTPATPDVIGNIDSALENVDGDTWDVDKGWQSDLDGIGGILSDILGAIGDIGKDVWDFFEEILNNIYTRVGDVVDSITSLTWDNVVDAINSLSWDNIVDAILSIPGLIWDSFCGTLQAILDAILGLVDDLLEGLKTLFIPYDGFFSDQFDLIKQDLSNYINIKDYNDIFNRQYESSNANDLVFKVSDFFNISDLVDYAESDDSPINIKMSYYNHVKDTVKSWLRAIFYFLICMFNIKCIYRILRGGSFIKDSDTFDGGRSQ